MANSSIETISSINKAQKEYFRSGVTLDIKFRKDMLKKLLAAMEKWDGKNCYAFLA